MTIPDDEMFQQLARAIGEGLLRTGLLLATAESCTGGLVAKVITDIPGSSRWFERGFVTYSNHAKTDMLGVAAEIITQHGAVSEATVRAMADGALQHSMAHISLSITGIAGPDGGSPDKPVGTVWFAWAWRQRVDAEVCLFDGDRDAVRRQAAVHALNGVLKRIA